MLGAALAFGLAFALAFASSFARARAFALPLPFAPALSRLLGVGHDGRHGDEKRGTAADEQALQ